MSRKNSKLRSVSRALALEPRLLFDGAAAVAAVDAIADIDGRPDQHHAEAEASSAPAASTSFDFGAASLSVRLGDNSGVETLGPNDGSGGILVVIDSSVPHYQSLINELPANATVRVVASNESGVAAISQELAKGQFEAVHILSHGTSGSLTLGTDTLNSGNLVAHGPALQGWAKHLTADADILLYGCDIASTQAGIEFMGRLSQATSADIAASNNPTGAADKGGDWVLEANIGSIEAKIFDVEAYAGLLADGKAAEVNTITITSTPVDGTAYKEGEKIKATVTFKYTAGGAAAPVNVSGTPSIELDIGGRIRTAQYVSGTGSSSLVFEYTVVKGDLDNSGGISAVTNSLATNNGSINNGDTKPVAVNITHVTASVANTQKVNASGDTIAPVLTAAMGSGSTITLSFDEIGSGLDASKFAAGDFTVVRNGGVGAQLNVTGVKVNAASQQVDLMLSGTINDTDSGIKISYQPTGSATDLQDQAGNKVDAFSDVFVAKEKPRFDVQGNNIVFDNGVAKVGTGKVVGSKILYQNVITIDGQSIDALVTIDATSNITLNYVDGVGGGSAPSALSGNPTQTGSNWFNLNTQVSGSNGYAEISFYFIKGGSYGTTNSGTTGVDVVLENVYINSYDIDGPGSGSSKQFQEFGGFATYTVDKDSQLNQTQNIGFTRFESNTSANTSEGPGTKNGDKARVMALYEAIDSFSIRTGATTSGTAYYYLDFSKGPNWADPAPTYKVPTVNSQTTNDTTPEITGTFVGTVSNSTDQAQKLTIAVNGKTYSAGESAAERTTLADGKIQLLDATTGLKAIFDPTTGQGTWSLTIPDSNALPQATYSVEAQVHYGPNLAGINKFTTDTTNGELIINGDPPDTAPPTLTSITRYNGANEHIFGADLQSKIMLNIL